MRTTSDEGDVPHPIDRDAQATLPLKIVSYELLPSTQDELRRRVLAGEDVHGLVVQAVCQSDARGQRARDWSAGEGGSYQTLAVRETGPTPPYAALVFALGIAEVLPIYGVQAGLKWPNDLYYRGKKLAGLLVERVSGYLLVGVGLNVNNDVPEGATALRGWDVAGTNMVVLEGLQRGLQHLSDEDFDLSAAYTPFDVLSGERLELLTAGTLHHGTGAGIDSSGQLLLRQGEQVTAYATGRLQRFGVRIKPPGRSASFIKTIEK